ncbi:hypothetical protein BX600DRAFT_448962 [Xylariales sp. PMI_506]|nr:hypothetical protein BX600DRAFT_448962 [Xylariales sp. PMI_506]
MMVKSPASTCEESYLENWHGKMIQAAMKLAQDSIAQLMHEQSEQRVAFMNQLELDFERRQKKIIAFLETQLNNQAASPEFIANRLHEIRCLKRNSADQARYSRTPDAGQTSLQTEEGGEHPEPSATAVSTNEVVTTSIPTLATSNPTCSTQNVPLMEGASDGYLPDAPSTAHSVDMSTPKTVRATSYTKRRAKSATVTSRGRGSKRARGGRAPKTPRKSARAADTSIGRSTFLAQLENGEFILINPQDKSERFVLRCPNKTCGHLCFYTHPFKDNVAFIHFNKHHNGGLQDGIFWTESDIFQNFSLKVLGFGTGHKRSKGTNPSEEFYPQVALPDNLHAILGTEVTARSDNPTIEHASLPNANTFPSPIVTQKTEIDPRDDISQIPQLQGYSSAQFIEIPSTPDTASPPPTEKSADTNGVMYATSAQMYNDENINIVTPSEHEHSVDNTQLSPCNNYRMPTVEDDPSSGNHPSESTIGRQRLPYGYSDPWPVRYART